MGRIIKEGVASEELRKTVDTKLKKVATSILTLALNTENLTNQDLYYWIFGVKSAVREILSDIPEGKESEQQEDVPF